MELQKAIDSLFDRSMNPIVFNYAMNGVPLKRVDTVCDLRITITNSLSVLVKSKLGWHSST